MFCNSFIDQSHHLLQPVFYGKSYLETTCKISERNPCPSRGQPDTWWLSEHTPYTGGKGIFNAIYLKYFQKSLRPLYKSIHFTKTFIHSLPTG